MKNLVIFIVYLTLAFASFGYARHHYLEKHSITVGSSRITNPLEVSTLFGDWVKEEWVFAIAVPIALIVGGMVMAGRRK